MIIWVRSRFLDGFLWCMFPLDGRDVASAASCTGILLVGMWSFHGRFLDFV
jgi:hypothetical protein